MPAAIPFHPSRLKTRFIINLRSGKGARLFSAVQSFARSNGAEVVPTERARHAFDLAQQAIADGCELIVAVGGDGTMNEVATALVNTPATLGLVPAGSGDGLGRHLGLHGSAQHALQILRQGRIQSIDTGTADGHAFFCAAGVGFEAEIAHRFNRLRRRGLLRYLTTSAMALRGWRAQEFIVSSGTTPSLRQTVRAFTLVIANASQYGNNARIAPRARVDDGLLDLCAVPPVTPWNALSLATRLFCGRVESAVGIVTAQSSHFIVERPSGGLLHTDGEVHTAGTRIEFKVRPASLRVMVPA